MNVILTPAQQQALARGEAVSITVDAAHLVVVPQDLFESLQEQAGKDHNELREIFARAVESSDWNDPAMDVYDEYDDASR